MGLPRSTVEINLDEIEQFSELGKWLKEPVRKYSSGMLVRLGFSVAMHANADVLLFDEVLAVGDFAFQRKCIGRLSSVAKSGMTVIIVSHNPYIVERMCDRVLILESGKTQAIGEPSEMIRAYFDLVANLPQAEGGDAPRIPSELRPGSGEVRITEVEFLDEIGTLTGQFRTGAPATIRLNYVTTHSVWEPNFGIRIYDEYNTMVLSFATTAARKGFGVDGEGFVDCQMAALPLMPGTYTIQVKVAGDVTLDVYDHAAKLVVRADADVIMNSGNMGIAFAEPQWHYSDSAPAANNKVPELPS
jgi:hypothetical protein